jgi:hypothetical protein
LTISGVSQHLISYYKIEDVEGGRLRSPSSLPELASLDISPEYLDKTHFRNPPKVEIGVDGLPRYRGEADDVESSPSLLPAPLSSGLPLLSDAQMSEGSPSAGKRAHKRFEPYGSTPPKRSRKSKTTQLPPSTEQLNQPIPVAAQQPSHSYPDPNIPVVPHPHYSPYGVTSYYQMPGYPIPPPHPHLYSPNPYQGAVPATTGSPSAQPQSGSPPQTAQYAYPGFSTTNAVDPAQSGQQAFYPYYPSHYPAYPGVTWPYTGYPPQPIPQQPAASASAVLGVGNKPVDVHHADGDGAEDEKS